MSLIWDENYIEIYKPALRENKTSSSVKANKYDVMLAAKQHQAPSEFQSAATAGIKNSRGELPGYLNIIVEDGEVSFITNQGTSEVLSSGLNCVLDIAHVLSVTIEEEEHFFIHKRFVFATY